MRRKVDSAFVWLINPKIWLAMTFVLLHTAFIAAATERHVPSQYPTIQAAIDAASNGDTVIVDDGIYGSASISGVIQKDKAITVRSKNGPANCIINGNGDYGFWFYHTGTTPCRLEGFTITNCQYDFGAIYCSEVSSPIINNCIVTGNGKINAPYGSRGIGGIRCFTLSSPVISNCIIANNYGSAGYSYIGAGILAEYSCNPTIINSIIVYNTGDNKGGGIYCNHNSSVRAINCIIWGNSPNEILLENGSSASIKYSDVQGSYSGTGNIKTYPMFVNANNGNYHLSSDSPCIDAGDPSSDFGLEPEPDGGRINMGAYGNTPEATCKYGLVLQSYNLVSRTRADRTVFDYVYKMTLNNNSSVPVSSVYVELLDAPDNVSIIDNDVTFAYIEAGQSAISDDTFTLRVDRSIPIDPTIISWRASINWAGGTSTQQLQTTSIPLEILVGDITGDKIVNLDDLVVLVNQWLQPPGVPSADIAPVPNGDGIINFLDFALLSQYWLEGTTP